MTLVGCFITGASLIYRNDDGCGKSRISPGDILLDLLDPLLVDRPLDSQILFDVATLGNQPPDIGVRYLDEVLGADRRNEEFADRLNDSENIEF
jgi:hypothetical protein